MDLALVLGAFGVGIIVGLTGMGGGTLMTPMLVLFFGISPLTAVSSDLVAAAVMKPVGSFVHLRRGTVNLALVKWLCVGSVPSAFAGVLILKAFGDQDQVQAVVKVALGVAILFTAAMLMVRAYMRLTERAGRRGAAGAVRQGERGGAEIRVLPTVLLGVGGGLVVGMTSVGSGSLIIIGLMVLYPGLKASQLVGTDLMQAVPLVASAALSHALFGQLDFSVSIPLIIGSVPGAYIGARLSAALPGGIVRRALVFVLVASGLKLLDVPNLATVLTLGSLGIAGSLAWMSVRLRHGFPALARVEAKQRRSPVEGAPEQDSGPEPSLADVQADATIRDEGNL